MGDSIIVNAMLYNTNRLLHLRCYDRNQTSGIPSGKMPTKKSHYNDRDTIKQKKSVT